ncbi:hypothetical protein ACFROC_01685 [Nocardia tengchongensis]|uniref:hypothetical protein n=1 Tax=Nocardia tengchongensis TaxID=2055889 RepID=UPI0036A41ACA
MTENGDSAAIHVFGAPDEGAAVVVAQALARFGFASVAVHSHERLESATTLEWEVTALDDGPYVDDVGESARAAIYRYAIAIATRLGGWEISGTRCTPTILQRRAFGATHTFGFEALTQNP